MKIRISDYILKGSRGDWCVAEIGICQDEKSKNYGKEYEKEAWYFGTLYQCVRFLLNCDLSDTDAVTLEEVRDELHVIGKHIKVTMDKIEMGIRK